MLLLTNDDGINASGLRCLYKELRKKTKEPILVVAPLFEQSAKAHSITLDRGLEITEVVEDGFFGFAVNGTPSDCVKVALKVICTKNPKLVISGINDGANVGRSIFYSGTVSAAMEARIEGRSAVAFSKHTGESTMEESAKWSADWVAKILKIKNLPKPYLANINLPGETNWKDLRFATHNLDGFDESYKRVEGLKSTWQITGEMKSKFKNKDSDIRLLMNGHPTISLLEPNLNLLDQKKWKQYL